MSLNPDCLAQLKLRQPPFEDVPEAAFVYDDPLLNTLSDAAREAVLTPAAVVLISGPDGSGRSLQLMRLLGVLPETLTLVAFRGRAGIGFNLVEATIRNQLGLGREGALDEVLLPFLRPGAGLVLAVDDADLLGPETFQSLMQLRHTLLERRGTDAPRLVLCGDAGLGRRDLELSEFDDPRRLVRLVLRPFNLEQSRAYLVHRLSAAGLDRPLELLSEDAIDTLHQHARGCPKALNALANEWLEARCQDTSGLTEQMSERIRTLAPMDQGGSAASVPLDDRASVTPPPQPLNATPAPPASTPEEAPSTAFAELMARIARESGMPPEQEDSLARAEDDPPQAERTKRKKRKASKTSTSPAKADTDDTPIWNRRWFVPAIAGAAALAIVLPVMVQLPRDQANTNGRATLPSSPRSLLEAVPEPRVTRDPDATPRATQPLILPRPAAAPTPAEAPAQLSADAFPLPAPETPAQSTSEPTNSRQPLPDASPPTPDATGARIPSLAADQAWLERQDPRRFTIQLIAVSTLDAATEYIERYRLDAVRYVPIRSRQRDLVVALTGAFPDRAAAEQAYRALPEAVRADQPWIRPIGSLRASLR